MKKNKKNYSAPALEKGLDIIELLSDSNQGLSQAEIAKKLNTSPRYVGNVCGQNKLLLVIPCHRVVKSDGSLGGFSGLGGLKLKKILLNLEMNV